MLNIPDLKALDGFNNDRTTLTNVRLMIPEVESKIESYKRAEREIFKLGHNNLAQELSVDIFEAEELLEKAKIRLMGESK